MGRPYYDHEPAYKKIAAAGGHGWDDLRPGVDHGSYRALDAFLASPWAPPAGASVLDLGCGGGQASLRLARLGGTVLGVDYSGTAVALARKNAQEAGLARVHFAVCDALALGARGPFDALVDNHLLHCIVGGDRPRALAEIRRVLRTGGVFFSETMSCEGDFDPRVVKADPATRESLNGTRFWTSRAELEALIGLAGFAIEHLSLEQQPQDAGTGATIVVYARATLMARRGARSAAKPSECSKPPGVLRRLARCPFPRPSPASRGRGRAAPFADSAGLPPRSEPVRDQAERSRDARGPPRGAARPRARRRGGPASRLGGVLARLDGLRLRALLLLLRAEPLAAEAALPADEEVPCAPSRGTRGPPPRRPSPAPCPSSR